MSMGVVGSVGRERMMDYAIAATIGPVWGEPRNKQTANCKVCGEKLAKGEGVKGWIADTGGPNSSQCYLCSSCLEWITGFRERWEEFKRERREQERSGGRGNGE